MEEVIKIANSRNAYGLADKALHEYFSLGGVLWDGNVNTLIKSYQEAHRLETYLPIVRKTTRSADAVKYYLDFVDLD